MHQRRDDQEPSHHFDLVETLSYVALGYWLASLLVRYHTAQLLISYALGLSDGAKRARNGEKEVAHG